MQNKKTPVPDSAPAKNSTDQGVTTGNQDSPLWLAHNCREPCKSNMPNAGRIVDAKGSAASLFQKLEQLNGCRPINV